MEEAGYIITNKEFKQISKWAENVYNIAVIADYRLVVGVKRARYRFSPLPTIRFLILRIILFSCLFWKIYLKLRQGLNFCKDRKRIKASEGWEILFKI